MLMILLKTFWAHFIFEYTILGLKNAPDEINPIWSANKSTLAKLGVRGKLPAGHWLYTPNRMQYFRMMAAAGNCSDILQDLHWPLVWMIRRLHREDKMLYRGSLHIENDLYHLHLLRVIVPQGTQGIRVLLSEDYPLSEPEMLVWFYCFVWVGGYYIYFFTSGSSQTLSKESRSKTLYSSPLPVRLSLKSLPIQPYHSAGFF